MSDNYKTIFKGTMLFGGVQVFQILVSFFRNKLNAIYLGPEGMGLIGLYNSSLSIIITIATMGFTSSAVRYIANEEDEQKKLQLIKTGKIVLLFQSLFGGLITVCFSRILSKSTFQSNEYIFPFMILSLFSFFSVLNNGNIAIIQGKMETRKIANANIVSSFVGLLSAIPLLIFFKKNAIIPVMLITPIVSTIYTEISIKKIVKNYKQRITYSEISNTAKTFLSYGFVITLSQLIGTLADYLLNIYITKNGSIKDIGYYNSGMNITYQCIGLVFNAMSMDYSPRLTAVCDNVDQSNKLINQQGVITLLLSLPILSVMLVSSPLLIRFFLSKEFLPITSFIQIIILGMIFKSITFCLGSVSFAKGDKKIFFFYEGIYGTLQRFFLSIVGYKISGLEGLAWSFVLNFFLYFITVSILCRIRYKFVPSKEYSILILLSVGCGALLFLLTRFNCIFVFCIECLFTLAIVLLCFIELEKRIQIINYVKQRLRRKDK